MPDGKTCTKCNEYKCYSEFHKKKSMPDGYRSACKLCTNKQNTEYRRKNPEKAALAVKRYKEVNKEIVRQKDAEYREANRDECRRRSREYARKHAEERSEYQKVYYRKNKEYVSNRAREYRRKYPEKVVIKEQRRRARVANLINDYTSEQWHIALNYFESRCCYCGKECDSLQQEHFIPVVNGGGYTVSNILPSCPSCNYSKGTKDFEEWYPRHYAYSDERVLKIFEYFTTVQKPHNLEVVV